jgi:hypothetical protein
MLWHAVACGHLFPQVDSLGFHVMGGCKTIEMVDAWCMTGRCLKILNAFSHVTPQK